MTPWTVNHQAPLSVGFPRQENWSGLPFPCAETRPNPETEPASTALQGGFSLLSHQGSQLKTLLYQYSDKTILKIFFSRMVVLNNSRLYKSSFLRTITLKSSLNCTFWGIRNPGFHSRTLCSGWSGKVSWLAKLGAWQVGVGKGMIDCLIYLLLSLLGINLDIKSSGNQDKN